MNKVCNGEGITDEYVKAVESRRQMRLIDSYQGLACDEDIRRIDYKAQP